MASPSKDQFVHRANSDGTVDSICRACFVTVATVTREADLDQLEKEHVCDSRLRERYRRESLAGSKPSRNLYDLQDFRVS